MTTKHFFAAVVCCAGLLVATEAHADSFRVNYDSRANADFLDLNAAMLSDKVKDGDVLYLDKGCTITTEQTVTKAVTIIGPGYFIGESDADEAYLFNTLYIDADGVKITGVHTSNITVRAEEVVIERCRVVGVISAASGYATDNCSVRSCFIIGQVKGLGSEGALGWKILNNIIYYYISSSTTGYNTIYNFYNALIDHNAIRYYNKQSYSYDQYSIHNVYNSTITNNIIENKYTSGYCINTAYLSSNNIISHNVLSCGYFSSYPNNKIECTTTSIFALDYSDSESRRDVNYALSEESAAKGYAEDGSDCGPYAGSYPYVLSGYPLYVPRFESIEIPSSPTNGKLNIRLTIKNQNE